MSVPICSEVSRFSGQNHRDGTRAHVRESGHVPSRFPSRDDPAECPDLPSKRAHTMTDLRRSMHATKSRKGALTILNIAARRLEDIRYIGWPALQQSLQAELDDCRAIATARGLLAGGAA